MHWILNVTFSKDDCRSLAENIRKSMSALRKFTLAFRKNFLAAHHKREHLSRGDFTQR